MGGIRGFRNVFDNQPEQDPEDGSDPTLILPPLRDGYHYALEDLPSGESKVSIEKNVKENTELDRVFPSETDEFGRHRI